MKPKKPEILPPFLYPPQSKTEEAWLTSLRKAKKIRKVGPRLYTSLPSINVKSAARAQWAQIVATLFPNALLGYRSALEYSPSDNGDIYLTSSTNRMVEYAGLKLHFVRGHEALEDDPEFLGFRTASLPRALLENLSLKAAKKSLPQNQIESRLIEILRVKGEGELNKIRDRAREIATELEMESAFKKLNLLIGALLGTKPAGNLKTTSGKARAAGMPFDSYRIARFDLLFSELLKTPLKEFKDEYKAKDHFTNKAFIEAYFSNFIEGTTFEIKEAEEIVFDKIIPKKRPKDAHDILETYNLVSDPNEMKITPKTAIEFEDIIKRRHAFMMANRPEVSPGEYKEKPNRAGDTHFVLPDEIQGTFEQGFMRYQNLPPGLARAIYIMFLVAEVHPFNDGNGRIARLMMSAEMHSQGLSTIIIPTVYREDYLSALRALTRRDRPDPLIRMISRAHAFSSVQFSPYKKMLDDLTDRNWFREPNEAKLID
jgi:hypothetical protein